MIKMRTIYISLISLVFVAFTSCEDKLDLKPISDLTTGNFYQTQDHMDAAVASMYNGLRRLYTQHKSLMAQCPSDNSTLFYQEYDEGPRGITKYATTTSNFVVLDYWENAFEAVYRANVVIDRAAVVEYEDPEVQIEHIATAKFVRALIYFDLVRFFGDVPMMTEPLALEEYYVVKRTPASEIWSFIKSDLIDAIAGLPEDVDGSGKANKWSALGILADVHLNLGEYSDSKTAIDQVINSQNFELFDNFADIYMDGNNNGKHSIFAIQFLGQTGEGNPYPTMRAPKFIDVAVWAFAGSGGNQIIPSQQIWDLYDGINDVRRDLSMANQWLDGRDGFVHDELWQLKHGISNQPFAYQIWGINHIVMRYAEALLISAEVENQLDNPARAVELVNLIRSRAKLLDFASADKAVIHQEVILQRRLELAFENERWFDMKRQANYTEIINEFINYTGTPEGISWNDTYLLYPIPILEISKVGSDVLTQNPGY
jgi:hypothetical protein